jgi:hypothetical protein
MQFFDADAIIGRLIDQNEEETPTADDLIAEMDRTGIARSLVTNHKIAFSNPEWGNEELRRDVTANPRLRGVFGTWVIQDRNNPPPAEAVGALIKQGAAGVQLWPAMCGFDFAPWQCPDLFAALSERRLPLFLHADQTNANAIHAVLQAFPRLVLILQRVPYGDALRMLTLMRACPSLHICTSPHFVGGSVLEQFDHFIGSERLVFGSGLFKFDAPPAVAQITYSTLSDAKKAAIAGGNLARLLEAIR